ncbi:holo-ACP synthase [Roseateles sp. BYS87W]|uniref:Holo-[acyl-carrier-protein] synthase n=1 Tax=Pelomonas baiyunensis TaxID=3299026 RepID=A0ABW7H3E1_9BURK
MIYGIGTDICDIRRIETTLARRGDRFAEKVLGPQELQVFLARRERSHARGVRFLATRFSAKEAFSKAIGLGLHLPMRLPDCQILNEASGRPVLKLLGPLADWFAERRLSGLVTLSDESDYAVSFVVVEQAPPAA